jgi:hypothetical protein
MKRLVLVAVAAAALAAALIGGCASSKVSAQSPATNLAGWYLTLPTPLGGPPGSAQEVKQPALLTFTDSPYFQTVTDVNGTGIQFMAPAGGARTAGTLYPRSELRELKPNRSDPNALASWSSTSGTSTMTVTGSCEQLPAGTLSDVIGQVHGPSSDIIEIVVDGTHTPVGYARIGWRWGPGGGATQPTFLDRNYRLGAEYTFEISASKGVFTISYRAPGASTLETVATATDALTGLYFKAGNYTQANLTNGSGAGMATIYALTATHT